MKTYIILRKKKRIIIRWLEKCDLIAQLHRRVAVRHDSRSWEMEEMDLENKKESGLLITLRLNVGVLLERFCLNTEFKVGCQKYCVVWGT